jgi:hypothetical protein
MDKLYFMLKILQMTDRYVMTVTFYQVDCWANQDLAIGRINLKKASITLRLAKKK